MAAEDLDDEERELLAAHRAAKKKPRKVLIHGEHEGVRYDFEVEGEEADRIFARHKSLFAPDPEPDDKDKGAAAARRSYLAKKPPASG